MLKRGETGNKRNVSKKSPLYPQNGELQGNQSQASKKAMANRARRPARERKLALLQDVDNLKKRLRHEENVHKALERAFNRPLGSLPRLPPYLPQCIVELLAEVAVLEEEVVRLEEQILNYRHGLYQEAVYTSSLKIPQDIKPSCTDYSSSSSSMAKKSKQRHSRCSSQCDFSYSESYGTGLLPPPLSQRSSSRKLLSNDADDGTRLCPDRFVSDGKPQIELGLGKENQSCPNSCKNKLSQETESLVVSALPNNPGPMKSESSVRSSNLVKTKCRVVDEAHESSSGSCDDIIRDLDSEANRTSEDILKCLINIFVRLSSSRVKTMDSSSFSSVSAKEFGKNIQESAFSDPYGLFSEFENRDIGAYGHLYTVEAGSVDFRRKSNSSFLIQRLKILLNKLESVKIEGLSHQQKLAFWINMYNSCIMNAFLEHGIPETPEMTVLLMQKATINVGGHVLNALMIEHLILRFPYHLKYTCPKSAKNDERRVLGTLGLEWSEPLVTFALCCGSWSSPAVRVYTASHIESELETAKRDYLQSAVGISASNKIIIIPKLLDWYLLDFAKDMDALMDWVCLQLSDDDLRSQVINILHNKEKRNLSELVQVMPYNFSFRYLVCR